MDVIAITGDGAFPAKLNDDDSITIAAFAIPPDDDVMPCGCCSGSCYCDADIILERDEEGPTVWMSGNGAHRAEAPTASERIRFARLTHAERLASANKLRGRTNSMLRERFPRLQELLGYSLLDITHTLEEAFHS